MSTATRMTLACEREAHGDCGREVPNFFCGCICHLRGNAQYGNDTHAAESNPEYVDDLRRRLNAALEASSIAESGRLEAERKLESLCLTHGALMAERDRYKAALEEIKGLGWQEQYIGPWIQDEAWLIARNALDPEADA